MKKINKFYGSSLKSFWKSNENKTIFLFFICSVQTATLWHRIVFLLNLFIHHIVTLEWTRALKFWFKDFDRIRLIGRPSVRWVDDIKWFLIKMLTLDEKSQESQPTIWWMTSNGNSEGEMKTFQFQKAFWNLINSIKLELSFQTRQLETLNSSKLASYMKCPLWTQCCNVVSIGNNNNVIDYTCIFWIRIGPNRHVEHKYL